MSIVQRIFIKGDTKFPNKNQTKYQISNKYQTKYQKQNKYQTSTKLYSKQSTNFQTRTNYLKERKRLLIVTVTIFKEYLVVTVTIFKKYLIVTIDFSGRGFNSIWC